MLQKSQLDSSAHIILCDLLNLKKHYFLYLERIFLLQKNQANLSLSHSTQKTDSYNEICPNYYLH